MYRTTEAKLKELVWMHNTGRITVEDAVFLAFNLYNDNNINNVAEACAADKHGETRT